MGPLRSERTEMATTSDNLCDLGSSCRNSLRDRRRRKIETERRASLSNPRWRADVAHHPARRRVTMSTSMRTSRRDPVTLGARPLSDGAPSRPRWLLRPATSDDHAGTRAAPSFPRRLVPPLPSLSSPAATSSNLPRRRPPRRVRPHPATEPRWRSTTRTSTTSSPDPVQASRSSRRPRLRPRRHRTNRTLRGHVSSPRLPRDLSQLSTKTSTRISGPLKRCLPHPPRRRRRPLRGPRYPSEHVHVRGDALRQQREG